MQDTETTNETSQTTQEGDIQLDSWRRGKHAQERLIAAVREYRGSRYVDLRVHYSTPDGFRPTGKGTTIRWVELDGVIAALQRAQQILSGGPDPVSATEAPGAPEVPGVVRGRQRTPERQ